MTLAVRVAVVFLFLGIALIVVGVIVGTPPVGVEGVYFNRSVGAPAYSGVFSPRPPGLFDPADGNLWLGAGVAVVLAASISLLIVVGRGRALPVSDKQ